MNSTFVDSSDAKEKHRAKWWRRSSEQGRIICDLCPRECSLSEGDRGFCFVRQNQGDEMVLTTYGLSTGFCVDPIEKKPLAHFYPGTSVLSFGTAGCNLGCKFCQNWSISKSREITDLSDSAGPDEIAERAFQLGCRSVAFTYNDPIIWAEYAIDCAKACRERGLKAVAVTAGYIHPEARRDFFGAMDAANVDLKAFTEEFYQRLTLSHLGPVLDTIKWLKQESEVWFELTNLVIPEENDSPDEIREMSDWIYENIGPDVPVHFSAFHPDFRLRNRPRTPEATLVRSREIALEAGLRYVYVGNVNDQKRQSTFCPGCGTCVIERNWHQLGQYRIQDGACAHCGYQIAGHFDADGPGNWGRKRMPVRISQISNSQHKPDKVSTKVAGEKMSPSSSGSSGASPTTLSKNRSQEKPGAAVGNEQALIVKTAAELVRDAVKRGPEEAQQVIDAPSSLPETIGRQTVFGIFVSLKKQGQLRACIGNYGKPSRISDSLKAAAVRSATADPRFPPIQLDELPDLEMEVWLLHSPERVVEQGEDRVRTIEVGKHGLIINRDSSRGLLLPGVAIEHRMNSRQFLESVCRKAQLPTGSWMENNTDLYLFEGVCLKGPVQEAISEQISSREPELLVAVRQKWAEILDNKAGSPLPVMAEDHRVAGLLMTLRKGDSKRIWSRISPKAPISFYDTVKSITEQGPEVFPELGIHQSSDLFHWQLQVIILSRPMFCVAPVGGMGLMMDPSRDALMVEKASSRGLVLPPHSDRKEMFTEACQSAGLDPSDVSVRAWTFQCARVSESSRQVSHTPLRDSDKANQTNRPPEKTERPEPTRQMRPAVKAGQFYPSDAVELRDMVGTMIPQQRQGQAPWPAIMVPHAGLRFSGKIAGLTFSRTRIPDRVIVIGPKHTVQGEPWAIEPHSRWSIPGGSIANDMELAQTLEERISGWQFDDAAHQNEHAIEVELPFLHALAPKSGVVGVAIGRTSLEQCIQFGEQLAGVLASMDPRPLLVISSDMHHFAPEAENRRLDKLAIDAMLQLNPQLLYETVRNNRITMCGVLPAVIVMETLRRLNQLSKIEITGYSTSADTTGDKSSVVGYCGMLLGG